MTTAPAKFAPYSSASRKTVEWMCARAKSALPIRAGPRSQRSTCAPARSISVRSLSRTDWTGATLVEVDFRRASLYGAVFAGAQLLRCDLRGVNLCSGDLRGARLVGCQTDGLDLDGAQL